MQDLGDNAPEDDARLVKPILEEPKVPDDDSSEMASVSSEDSAPEAKQPSTRECLVNIAAESYGDIWQPGVDGEYVLDLDSDSVHLKDAQGIPMCWQHLTHTAQMQKRKRCVHCPDPGTSEICDRCVRYSSKRRKMTAQEPL